MEELEGVGLFVVVVVFFVCGLSCLINLSKSHVEYGNTSLGAIRLLILSGGRVGVGEEGNFSVACLPEVFALFVSFLDSFLSFISIFP